MAKMTFQPKKRQRSKVHGFRSRMSTANGRKVLARRRAKGRHQLSANIHYEILICVGFSVFVYIFEFVAFFNRLYQSRISSDMTLYLS